MHVVIKLACAVAVTVSIAACVGGTSKTVTTAAANPRIEYRNLMPVGDRALLERTGALASPSAVPVRAAVVTQEPPTTQAPVLLDFDNDSATLDVSRIDFVKFKRASAQGLHFFVVGQSHGVSSVGVQTLAVKRAQAVGRALRENGIGADRIHLLASWGATRDAFAPSRGVHVYMLAPSDDPALAVLALQPS